MGDLSWGYIGIMAKTMENTTYILIGVYVGVIVPLK